MPTRESVREFVRNAGAVRRPLGVSDGFAGEEDDVVTECPGVDEAHGFLVRQGLSLGSGTIETSDGAGPGSSSCAVRRGKPIAAVSAPRAATTNSTQNAAWKAFTPARETRTVDTAATPTAPPISRMVSTSPDARPVIERVTPDRAPICAAGAAIPPATLARSSAGSRSVAKSPPAVIRVSSSTEIARSDWATTSRRRTPTTPTSLPPVIAAATNDVAVVASQATPVRVGEYPRTCCISSEPRKMKAKNAPNVENDDRFAATSVRLRIAEPGTSGDRDRASIPTKAESSTTDAAKSPSVDPESQPCSAPW